MLARILFCAAITLFVGSAAAGVASAVWKPAGTLNVPRYAHSATLLQDGRVLVAGGRTDCCSNSVASAEVYDPNTNSWATTGSMKLSRVGHSATRLLDGRVLVVGGAELPNAELYDPRTGNWTLVDGPKSASFGFTLILLPSGRVLLPGGASTRGTLASAELFDSSTATWQVTGSMVEARTLAAGALMSNGKVLVAGGLVLTQDIENPTQLQTAEIYDPSTDQWQATTNLNRLYLMPEAIALRDGRILVLGDVGDTEYYEPTTAKWTISGTRATPRQGYAAAVLATGQVLVAGGYDNRIPAFLADAAVYDPASGGWTAIASMITARNGHTATTLANGDVLVVGGYGVVNGNEIRIATAERLSLPAAIGPGHTGAWYDPAQSGHGLFIEVLPDNRMLAAWFTFAPGGGQSWFYGVGTYSGNTASIPAVDQPTGGRWIPNFDPAKVVHNAWGNLTLTFTDCNHGRVDFDSTLGYGSGSMSLTRLTQPVGPSC